MGDVNPIRTLGDDSKPSHEGYMNTIDLLVVNNVVPLRSDTIRLVQNGCSFHELWSEDRNQHLKDFLKLMDSLDLDGESLSEAWTRFKDLLQKAPHHGIDLWLQDQIFYDHVNPVTRRTIDQSAGGKLRDKNTKESWALLEDHTLYDNESWNDPRDFAKPVKAIYFPQDEDGNVKTSTTEYEDHKMTVESEEEFEEENEDDIKEEEEDSPKHFDTFPTMKELRHHEWL
nr:MAK10-like protein [Tanacetum cinerariifolium]